MAEFGNIIEHKLRLKDGPKNTNIATYAMWIRKEYHPTNHRTVDFDQCTSIVCRDSRILLEAMESVK